MLHGIEVLVAFAKEGDTYVAYCPALELSSQGDSIRNAQKNFEEAIKLFFEELERMGTLEQALTELGWIKTKTQTRPKSTWVPPRRESYPKPYSRIPLHILARRQVNVERYLRP